VQETDRRNAENVAEVSAGATPRGLQRFLTEAPWDDGAVIDTVQELIKVDHGWWSAQLYEPYVSEKVAFAIRYHQALRFYEDKQHGYEYPEIYRMFFGEDYKPEPYIEAAYQMVRNHKWYFETRMVTVNDLYSFEPGVNPQLEEFTDIIGRHFKQPKEGLGFDNSPVAHMWRSIATPDRPL